MNSKIRAGVVSVGLIFAMCACAAIAGTPPDSHDHHGQADATAEDGAQSQERCPVRGNPINEDVYVIHQG